MTNQRRLRLGFFTYLEGAKPQAEIYQDVIEVFTTAERFGFDVGWVAQHHFGHHGGLPSPFVFFAALAAKTERIGVGTAIVSLPLEHPIRVAEDAATLDALFPGRLELGVGTGFASDQVMLTFDQAGQDRRELYNRGLPRLLSAFEGEPVNADGDRLNPPAPELRKRVWESPASLERTADAARRGNGLLLSRIAIGGGTRPSAEIQVPLVERYLSELPDGVQPRIGFSRTVYPTRRPDIAFRDLSAGLEESVKIQASRGEPPDGMTVSERFKHHNIHFGAPEAVIESLLKEPLLDQVTDLICQVGPGSPAQSQILEAIELIATEVAPALGWIPARSPSEAVATR
jgi:alkanesulfonate monooxygenase SsuD/methylene tetrahydromethanopterin reductase-like flavin-dependent oxidoreductase (luciferase family)